MVDKTTEYLRVIGSNWENAYKIYTDAQEGKFMDESISFPEDSTKSTFVLFSMLMVLGAYEKGKQMNIPVECFEIALPMLEATFDFKAISDAGLGSIEGRDEYGFPKTLCINEEQRRILEEMSMEV